MSNELFTDLSVEQQEVVAGGLDVGFSTTDYFNKISALQAVSQSGPGGSTAGVQGATDITKTSGLTGIGLGLSGLPAIVLG